MNARNTGLLLVKHAGYKITKAMTNGTGQRREIALNASSFENSNVRGGQRRQGRNAPNRTRPIGLCLGGGDPNAGFGDEGMERSSGITFAMRPNAKVSDGSQPSLSHAYRLA